MSPNKKLFILVWLGGTLSVLAVLPYAFSLQQDLLQSAPFSLPILALLSLLQSTVLLGVATSLGLFFAKKVGFKFTVLEEVLSGKSNAIPWKDFLRSPIVLGIVTAVVIYFGDWLFKLAGVVINDKYVTEIPIWKRFLASFYGGIGEEILLRLFLYKHAGLCIWQDHTKRGTSFSKRFGVVSSCYFIHYFRSWSFACDFGDYRPYLVGYSQSYRSQWNSRAGVRLALLEAWLGVGNDCSFHRRFNDFDCITGHSCINGKNCLPSKINSSY
jgi:hypothetical protein